MTVMRPLSASSFATLCSRHTPDHLITPVKRVLHHALPEFPEAPMMQTFTLAGSGFSQVLCCFHVFFPRVSRLPIQDEAVAQLFCRVMEF